MINALTQSPIVAKKIFEWKEQLEKNELLIRDIIDIDSTYEDFEDSEENDDKKKKTEKDKKDLKLKKENKKEDSKQDSGETNTQKEYVDEDDEFNVSLAAMEEEIKPKIMLLIENLLKITPN